MITTRWFALSALGALLAVTGVGCGGSSGGGGTAGAGGSSASGTAGAFGGQGQAGTSGGQGQAGDGGQAGTGGGQAGRQGGGNDGGAGTFGGNNDGGAGRQGGNNDAAATDGRRRDAGTPRDATVNIDAIIGDILAGLDANLPACAADVMDNGTCTRGTSARCKPTTGNACICGNNNRWVCF